MDNSICNQSVLSAIIKTTNFAAIKHKNQRRKDPEKTPYINHPIGVAYLLVESGLEDVSVIQAALLHDTVEDTDTSNEELVTVFGEKVAGIVAEDNQITSSSTNNQPSNRLQNNEENRKDKIAAVSILNIPSKSSPPQPQLPNNASARVTAQIYIRIPGNPFEREIRNTLTNQGIPSEEVLIKELSRKPNWVSFAITISKGFEYVPYKLNQWPTGTSVQPFRGGKQWTQPGYSTKYPKLQSYQNKQQRANETIPYTRDYRKRHDTILSYRRPRTRDFSWSDGSYNPRHSPRHTNFGKARSYHGTYSNQRYTSNGRYRHQDPWANPRTHYNDEFPAESHSRNYDYDYGYHPNETW
ncbi:Guanosine-3',5'-bis(diphosphate) 3'-pyrophosphohydrolase MESH1 [Halocaridina rubra]|uniref:Guanosine-3',5'-bis(diphosphate) 3'-pyrophosphohydrolase MESH1 n=1 Tax=Halocaridina rubra TaxID=373956 RepID=A0AAN8W8Q0_HALRR